MKDHNYLLPKDHRQRFEEICREAESVEGYLHPYEMQFLALLGAVPTTEGEILEIGTFRGKSTVILAKAAALSDSALVNAVDPMRAPYVTEAELKGRESLADDFFENVRRCGVEDRVRLHQMTSAELAPTWNSPLRLLWIDGDHSYAATKIDFDGFYPHLADGAIVAIHDVLHLFDGSIRVFMEDILSSPNFGASGICRSIGWAQFRKNQKETAAFSARKMSLFRKLERLLPAHTGERELVGMYTYMYKVYRSAIPHGQTQPEEWLTSIFRKNDANGS